MVVVTRLVRNAVLTVRVMVVGVFWKFFDRRGSIMGASRMASVSSIIVLRSSGASITFTWSCTKMSGS